MCVLQPQAAIDRSPMGSYCRVSYPIHPMLESENPWTRCRNASKRHSGPDQPSCTVMSNSLLDPNFSEL